MGGYQGKSVESGTSNRLSDQAVDSEETGANCETSSDSNRSIWFKLRDWKSVRRTVNHLCEDGKHAFSFSPGQKQDNNGNESNKHDLVLTANKRNSDGQTPLTYSIHQNDVDTVRSILLNPAVDVNYPEKRLYCGYRWDFYPPLIVAVQTESTDIVKLLLLSGAFVNTQDSLGFSALYHASKIGHKEIVILLLNYSPDLSGPPTSLTSTITDPLQIACCYGHTEVVELLIKAGYQVNSADDTSSSLLNAALDSENHELCLLLLQHGASLSRDMFFKACQYGCEKVVRYMIHAGINVRDTSEHGETALMFSLNPGALNRIRRKFRYTKDKEISKKMAYEILQRDVNMLNLLCENGCDLEVKDSLYYITCLQRSLQFPNLPAVIVLLKHGASFELDDEHLHIQYVNDEVFKDLSDLYRTFIYYYISDEIFKKRKVVKLKEQPTTLQHICRIKIRQILKACRKESCSIVPIIKTLKLAPRLKDFLCYNEINEMDISYCDKVFHLNWCVNR